MCYLGLNFILNKMLKRYERSIEMRKHGMATHYMNDKEKITIFNDKAVAGSLTMTSLKID